MDSFLHGLLPLLAFAASLTAVLACFVLLASLVRRRGVAGSAITGAMASYDEALHGTAHDSYVEIQVQAQRPLPVRSPDDPWRRTRDETGSLRRTPRRRLTRPRRRGLRRR